MSLKECGQLNGLLSMSVLSCILPKLIFTITERIVARWLVESYGLWEFRPWKWRKWSRSAGCFVFGFSPKKNECYWKTHPPQFSMVYTLIDHRNVWNFSVKQLACCSWFHLSFEHFMTSSLRSIRVWSRENCKIVVNLLNNLQAKGGKSHMKETGTLVRNQELNAGLKVTNLGVAQASFDP